MDYRINLWRVDGAGHWTAYAAGRKPDGTITNNRNTQSAANPPLGLESQWAFNAPPFYRAAEAALDFKRIADQFPTAADVEKMPDCPTDDETFCLGDAVQFLEPTAPLFGGGAFKGAAGLFLTALLSVPRFIDAHGLVEIGSEDIIEIWRRTEEGDGSARLMRPKTGTSTEAIQAEAARLDWFAQRVARVRDFILAIGRRTSTSGEAKCATSKIDALVNLLLSLGNIADIPQIDAAANEAAEALQAMCDELAAHKDAQPTTAQAADGDAIARKVDAIGVKMAPIINAVEWLVDDRKNKIKDNQERGKAAQAKAKREGVNAAEKKRAADDKQTALNRVHDRMKHGARYVVAECRTVCKKFKPLTTKKNALGEYEEYAPLRSADGKSIKPKTLARYYRERFGTQKAKKAKAAQTAKPKRRTK